MALALPAAAGAHAVSAPAAATALGPTSCSGAAIQPTQVITGEFRVRAAGQLRAAAVPGAGRDDGGAGQVLLGPPEAVPSPAHARPRPVPGARPAGRALRPREFRGWGGSSHPDVIVSPEGFKSEAEYVASPRTNVPGKTTRGFMPGPIAPGEWAVELGVAAVITQAQGDADGKVGWRVEIELSSDPSFADEPYEPAAYDSTPARAARGWYARRHARPRGALRARRRDHDGDLRLRVQAAFGGRRGPGLHHALRLRRAGRLGGDRSPPARVSGQADRAQRGGDHLPRPHEQPHQRDLRRLPHRPDLRARARRHAGSAPRGAPAPRAVRRRARRRWLHPDQPPDDLPVVKSLLPAVLPRVPVGLHRRGDRLLERRRHRGEHRAAAAGRTRMR